MLLLLPLIALVQLLVASVFASRPLVHTSQGALRGRRQLGYFSFEGIPYAKPPVGELAFKPPEAAGAWKGEREAGVGAGTPCHQRALNWALFQGAFDCLYLNVYTPKLPKNGTSPQLPVMVWIYGGGFALGFAAPYTYGPDYLVREKVVVVTFNYRVGPYGFLSLGTPEYSGNMGLKDQVLALRWVRSNIAAFGGDPNRVTIFGQSAGAVSVHYHMLSPMSAGLFDKAISQSGSVLMHWGHQEQPRDVALRLADSVGCRFGNDHALIACLSKADPKAVTEEAEQLLLADRFRIPFVPTSEPIGTFDPFLTENPEHLLQAGRFNRSIPFILGVNSAEGILTLPLVMLNSTYVDLVKQQPQFMLPPKIDRHLVNKKYNMDYIGAALREFYFANASFNKEGYVEFQTDVSFDVPIVHTARIHAKYSTAPVFMYEFDYSGFKSLAKFFFGGINFKGACHADDIFYLFRFFYLPEMLERGTNEWLVSRRLARMWTQFAKTGRPTSNRLVNDTLIPIRWDPFDEDNLVTYK